MNGATLVGDERQDLDPPKLLFERLRTVAPGYTWDESKLPFHSSYDNWQVFGSRNTVRSGKQHATNLQSIQTSKRSPSSALSRRRTDQQAEGEDDSESATSCDEDIEQDSTAVVARISTHALREERAYYLCKSLINSVDPDGNHIVRPIDIMRLPSQQGDKGPIVVCIFEHPGPNILSRYIDYGPAWYKGRKAGDKHQAFRDEMFTPPEQISLQTFLEFAVGATECLEVLHHGQRIVHGEIRGDAFHMNVGTGRVKFINFGSGLRTFEHGLTSTGWSTLSTEIGAKTKLSYMSPEQTGRMPAEPDSRTDIYSLGVLFWTLLTQQSAFDGETPMDIIQGVLGRRVPMVSSIRLDIPDVIGKIIQKMTAKAIGDRYHSASGLRYDLLEVQRLLGDGNSAALKDWQIATKDISSFFILPTTMIGRKDELDEIVKIIDKVSQRHLAAQRQDIHSLSSGSSVSNPEDFEAALGGLIAGEVDLSISSEGDNTSPADRSSLTAHGTGSRELKSFADSSSDHFQSSAQSQLNSPGSHESIRSNASRSGSNLKPWEKKSALSLEARSGVESIAEGQRSSSDGAGSLTSQRNTHKFRRKGRCEVVSIAGAAGLGKSCLVQSVQVEARRRGYFASSKFDQTKKTPFGPVLKILSTLFKQVFSESNTDTAFHQLLKQYVRPAWPMLHKVLGLPEFLLGPKISPQKRASQAYNKSIQQGMGQRASSSASSSRNSTYTHSVGLGVQSSQDFLRAGSSTKSTRLLNTFLDVLRVFTQHKFICLCLDDLQFADDESLDLITQIVAARMKLVLMVTYRPDEMLPARIKAILEPPNTEGIKYIKASGVGITRIELRPLSEDDIVQYVALALCRPMHEIIPLAAVIQSKTAGNPFYMREMLDTCHRKQCIWYDYGDSVWRYDLDRIFKQFETADYHDTLDHKFIDNRLNELPASSRSILAWASLLGSSFSFELVQRLINGEFYYENDNSSRELDSPDLISRSEQEAIGGLQAAIQAYIIVPTQDDDRFRFAHDRYIQAAKTLRYGNCAKMHFIIAQTLSKYYVSDERYRDITASHISESIDVINQRVMHRQSFRKALFDCAQSAAESGARSTAAKYYANCFALLQPSPWIDDGAADCYYDETLALYIRASECYLYMGQYEEAKRLIHIVFSNARTAVDQAPCWVLESRIYSQEGDSEAAFHSLKHCLKALNIEFDNEPSFDKCDAEFERLSLKIQSIDRHELINRSMTTDPNLGAVGAVLVETISAAFWSNTLTFYQMSLVMINTHICHGAFPQAGMAYLHLAVISIARFNMIKFASELGNISLELIDRWRDPYTMGRGNTVYDMFVGHVQHPLQTSIGQLEGTLEYTIQAGDRISTILNFGLVSLLKFFASDHLSDLESFCTYGCEEVPNWQHDTRGGTMLISVRQLCRSLQGKTSIENALEIMTDESFNSELYCTWLTDSLKDNERPILLYRSMEIVPLFLYGHYSRAVDVGTSCLEKIESLWSIRNSRLVMFFQGISLAGQLWNRLYDPRRSLNTLTSPTKELSEGKSEFTEEELRQEVIKVKEQMKYFKKKIEDWQLVTDVNYFAWSKLLAAQLAEMEDNHSQALRFYEEVLDHASTQNFVFEEALGNYLLAGFFLRQGSRRPAKSALREAIMLYRQFGATGVAKYIEDLHSLLLQGPTRNLRTAEIGVQTDFAGDSAPVQYQTLEGDENEDRRQTRASVTETKVDRIDAWQGGSARPEVGGGLPALDMLDLTSILESSQVISSVLQIDELLKTMCEIILQNCGGLAELAAIVVEEDDPIGWSIAASGDPDKGAEAHIPGLPVQESSLVAENVIIYCTRFRETVFLPNLIHDERFSNVSERWSDQHSLGRAVIAIPISHGSKPLLGVLYLEGQPNVFTDRNLTVLQLLVNQIGISYSNALTLKAIEKVSASNISMVDMQKKALAKSIEAEAKAKTAEAEALRNVQLAEEAAKAKSIFLANVSHELRTPLNGVIGNSELLKDSDLRQDQAEMADSIRVSADLLLTVINDILDFSKMEADKMKLFIVAFNADEMIREVIRSVSYSNRDKNSAKNVEIIQDIHLPNSLIFGDPVRLHQVLGNLIGNSLKFTEEGSITIGAKTDWETKEAVQLTFWVKDTGIGIPPNKLANLFKPFSQADASTARKYGGSGLGLSICRSLIESMMGGKIELESVEGVGTTAWFTVSFSKADPETSAGDAQNDINQHDKVIKEVDLTQREKSNAIPTTDFSSIPREELRICIAEDNPINQRIAIQFMQKLGFKHVDAYVNGLEAVKGLRRKAMDGQPYHIILMDVQMPVMDGYEATKLLRKDPLEAVRTILVIAMTASAIQGDREKCLESGMNDYLAKPVRSGILKRKLDQYLLQAPLPITNLQADAKHIANDVLKEANGALSPSLASRNSSGITIPKAPQNIRITSGSGLMNGRGSPLRNSESMSVEADITPGFSSSEEILSPKSTPRVSRSIVSMGSGSENSPPNANGRLNSVVRVEASPPNMRLAKGKEKEKR